MCGWTGRTAQRRTSRHPALTFQIWRFHRDFGRMRPTGGRALRLGVKASAAAFMLHHSSHVDQQRPDDDFCRQMDRPRLAMPRVPLYRHPPLYRLSQRCRSHPCSSLLADLRPGGWGGGLRSSVPVLCGVLVAVR